MTRPAPHRTPVRMPVPLFKRLEARARQDHRSINGQIVRAIEEHLGLDELSARRPVEEKDAA